MGNFDFLKTDYILNLQKHDLAYAVSLPCNPFISTFSKMHVHLGCIGVSDILVGNRVLLIIHLIH